MNWWLIPLLSFWFGTWSFFWLFSDWRVLGDVSVIPIIFLHFKFSFHLFILSAFLFKTFEEFCIQGWIVLFYWDIVLFAFFSQWLMLEVLKAKDRQRVMLLLLRLYCDKRSDKWLFVILRVCFTQGRCLKITKIERFRFLINWGLISHFHTLNINIGMSFFSYSHFLQRSQSM